MTWSTGVDRGQKGWRRSGRRPRSDPGSPRELLRPFLHLVAFDHAFSNPPVAELSLYVLILALLIVLF
jgi:hypothetical protein